MFDFTLGYREVIPDQTVLDPWREISLNTGGTQGTLQDIKVAERANGFCYRDQTKHHTRNRFIYWRISHDILELVEHSLDINLAGNRIRYKFVDTPILDGVSIHETYYNVIVLVPTVCTVHRLIFPHPDKYHRQDDLLGTHPDLAAPSIFSEATVADARDPSTFHFFSNTASTSSQLPYLADSSLTLAEEEAIFVLAYPSSEILLVKQSKDGKIVTIDLKSDSIVPRFLSGLADKIRQKDKDGETTVSLLLHTFALQTYALTLCRNGQLKFWSCTKGECVAIIDVNADAANSARTNIQGAQTHILRKAVDAYDSDCLLGVFMSFSTECHLHVLRPVIKGLEVRLLRLNILHLPQNDLIDFAMSSSRIWTVWRGKEGDCEVYTSLLQAETEWTPVILEAVPDSNQPPSADGESDPREVYLQYIFHPGRFPLNIVNKALNIYKKSNVIGDLNLSTAQLKQQICMAVENEIQNELKQTVVQDEDYLEYANDCWQRFYSCCVQYHITGLKPLGLLLLPNSSGAVFLKKSMVSFLRPLDIFEHMMYHSDIVYKEQIMKLLNQDQEITDDVIVLFQVIDYLNQQMSEIFSYTFEKELTMLKSPDVVMSALLEKIQCEMDNEFTDYVAEILGKCFDLYQAMHKILELLRVDQQLYVESMDSETVPSINYIFTSHLGVSLVAGCLRQQTHARFLICRNLLLIRNILVERNELDWSILEAIRSVCTPEIVVLTQANYVSLWLSNLPAVTHLPTETAMLRLSSLKLNPVFNFRINHTNTVSLLELFIGSTGGYDARKNFLRIKHTEDTLAHWHLSLLPYLNCLFHIIWPVSGPPILAEWLLSCGQHLWLQQYVRLLSTWCEWNSCTHSFFLATSLLTAGEFYKAQELFQLASEGIFTDQFLAQRISNLEDQTRAYISYFLKVIHLFELHKAYDCAISLANTALSIANTDDLLAATLYSIKFKHHLALRNYEMAYDSLISNPDDDRKKDNLRDLVKHLLDEKQLDVLMQFCYGNLEELFCNILFTRARASDALNNVYYDVLYVYQMKRGPSFLRLAASVMYEQAFRLSQSNDADSLEKQVKCLLAAKNALQLCDPQFAFIVVPVEQVEDKIVVLPNNVDADDEPEEIIIRKQISIVNLEILKKDLLFASAKLRLIRFNAQTYIDVASPTELIVLLTAAGLFKTALEICQQFDLSYLPVFQNLTIKCINLKKASESVAWKWLIENDLQDLPANTNSASVVAWSLLEECLFQYEEDKHSTIHQTVCNEILKMHQFIPHWLLSSYKLRNPAELFRLLYNSGRLREATEIAIGYIMAALGHGKEYYGLSHAMQPTKPSIYLPVNGFINLLDSLEYINETDPEQPYLTDFETLKGVLDTYVETAQRISNEMCHYHLSQSFT